LIWLNDAPRRVLITVKAELDRSEAMHGIKVLTAAIAMLAISAANNAWAQEESEPESGSNMGQGMMGGGASNTGQGMMGEGGSMMGPGMMDQGGTMMGRRGMMHGMGKRGGALAICGKMTGHVEGRLAFLKAELKITPEQETLWNDYAAAVRDTANALGTRCAAMYGPGGDKAPSLLERLDAQEQFMAARLDGLRAVSKALRPLYVALNDEQKQLADQFIKSSSGMM
jgi:hypothetical protein